MAKTKPIIIGGESVKLGERRDIDLEASENYSGSPVVVPVTVWRADEPGPTVFVTAAVHGDELNGTGIVREILLNQPFKLTRGSLVLVPVVNMLGLERHQRYLPDRRDLNRSFPGGTDGSLARRFAHAIFNAIVPQCDYGIDLHTAAVRRTNYPNIRADLSNPKVKELALAFKSELIINGKGPKGSFRRTATSKGCPTIILEAGEVWKIEPSVVEVGVRGIRNVLIHLGMVEGKIVKPPFQICVDRTKWVRAETGGILQFHCSPGDIINKDQPIATNSDLHGHEQRVISAPADGVIIGMTTLPVVIPGDPVVHLAIPKNGTKLVSRAIEKLSGKSLPARVRDDLSTSIAVSEPTEST